MARLTYHRGLRLKSKTQATCEADNPWLDDQTTTHYRVATALEPARNVSLQRVAALPERAVLPPSAATLLVPAPPASTRKQRADAALELFWKEQSQARRKQIMARAFDPKWVRALAALVGISMCVVFGWIVVAGPELPSFAPKTKTVVPAVGTPTATPEPPHAEAIDDAPTAAPAVAASGDIPVADKRKPSVSKPSAAVSGSSRAPRTARSAKTRKAQVQGASPSAGRPATLHINSRPASEVTIDDKPIGSTPQLSISLEPGVHNVRLHNRQLNLLKILTLHVLPGETIDRVELLDP